VFLTTHYLEEADALCDRILVIDHGEIVASGAPEELKRRISGDTVELTLGDDDQAAAAGELLGGQVEGALVRLQLPSAVEGLPGMFRALDEAGIAALGVAVHRPTLDDVFLSLTGHALRDEEEVAA
jgi:ABC-2 type transport system ATP-binding protein